MNYDTNIDPPAAQHYNKFLKIILKNWIKFAKKFSKCV